MKPPPFVVNLMVAVMCLIWGSTWYVITIGLEDVPPYFGVAYRFTLASAVFWLLGRPLARMEGGTRAPLWMVLLFGSLNFAASYAIVYWSETRIPSALVSVLWAAFPMMMAVAGHLYLPNEKLRGPQWLGFGVGFLGVAWLFRTDLASAEIDAVWAGVILLISPLVSAVGQVAIKRHGEGVSSILLNRDGMTLASVYLWILAFLFERDQPVELTTPAVLSIVYLALFGTCAAFGMYYWVLRFTPAYKLSLIAYVTPVIAILIGGLVGKEPIGAGTVIGAGLVLGGVALVRR